MAVKTQTDIALMVLEYLGLVPEGQSPSSARIATAKDGVANAHAELASANIAWWGIDECPTSVASALSHYVAGDLAPQLAVPERIRYYQSGMMRARRRMAAVVSKRDISDRPTEVQDF